MKEKYMKRQNNIIKSSFCTFKTQENSKNKASQVANQKQMRFLKRYHK